MKAVSSQTRSRFVWIALTTSNGKTLSSGSGPRYLATASRPKTICKPKRSRATTK
jgi:hypothetical protein